MVRVEVAHQQCPVVCREHSRVEVVDAVILRRPDRRSICVDDGDAVVRLVTQKADATYFSCVVGRCCHAIVDNREVKSRPDEQGDVSSLDDRCACDPAACPAHHHRWLVAWDPGGDLRELCLLNGQYVDFLRGKPAL